MQKVWVLYRGDTPVGTGSQQQLADMYGVSLGHIKKMSTPKYIKKHRDMSKAQPNNKLMHIVKVSL